MISPAALFMLRPCYGLNVYVSPPTPDSYVEALTPKVMAFEDEALGRSLELDEVMRVGPFWWNQCPCERRHNSESSLSLHTHALRKGHLRIVRRSPFASQEKRAHQEPNWLAHWSWTSQPPELCWINVYGLSQLVAFCGGNLVGQIQPLFCILSKCSHLLSPRDGELSLPWGSHPSACG